MAALQVFLVFLYDLMFISLILLLLTPSPSPYVLLRSILFSLYIHLLIPLSIYQCSQLFITSICCGRQSWLEHSLRISHSFRMILLLHEPSFLTFVSHQQHLKIPVLSNVYLIKENLFCDSSTQGNTHLVDQLLFCGKWSLIW